MNKKYKVRFSPLFYKDLEEIIDYIKNKLSNKKAAEELVDTLFLEIEKRKYFPMAYESYVSKKERKDTYYKIHVKNYIVFYVVKDEYIEIRRMLYSRSIFNGKI